MNPEESTNFYWTSVEDMSSEQRRDLEGSSYERASNYVPNDLLEILTSPVPPFEIFHVIDKTAIKLQDSGEIPYVQTVEIAEDIFLKEYAVEHFLLLSPIHESATIIFSQHKDVPESIYQEGRDKLLKETNVVLHEKGITPITPPPRKG